MLLFYKSRKALQGLKVEQGINKLEDKFMTKQSFREEIILCTRKQSRKIAKFSARGESCNLFFIRIQKKMMVCLHLGNGECWQTKAKRIYSLKFTRIPMLLSSFKHHGMIRLSWAKSQSAHAILDSCKINCNKRSEKCLSNIFYYCLLHTPVLCSKPKARWKN